MDFDPEDAYEESEQDTEPARRPRVVGPGPRGGKRRDTRTGRKRERPVFRIHARSIALTYSQCGFLIASRDQLGNHLLSCGHPVECCIVAEEHHKDGAVHYHAFVQYYCQHNFTDCKHWDFNGAHPQAKGARQPAGWIKYLRKEDQHPWTHGYLPGEERNYLALATEGKVKEAIYQFKLTHPRDFVLHKPSIEANLGRMAKRGNRARYDLSRFAYRPFDDWDRRTTLILADPTDIGKTELAKAYLQGNFLFCRTLDCLKELDQEANPGQGIILDDFNLKAWEREEIIHLFDVDNDTTIKCRYCDARIPEGTPRIMTTNKTMEELFGHLPSRVGIDRRITFVWLDGDLFDRGLASPPLQPLTPLLHNRELINLSLDD